MNPSKIVIVCAMKEEFAAVEAGLGSGYRERFELIQAGIGPASAARLAKELTARATPPELLISTGFCGGLVDALHVGNLVVGCEIVGVRKEAHSPDEKKRRGDTTISRSITRRIDGMNLDKRLVDALQRANLQARLGRMASVADAVSVCDHKRQIARQYGAHAVDMESYALLANFNAKPSRIIFLRAVSDCVTDELPAEVGEFLTETGQVRITKIARFVLKKPTNIKRLMELKNRADAAAKALTDAWRAAREINFDG